ncbi:MAG: alpha/beta hydrolase [Pseudomonadota bacterium]
MKQSIDNKIAYAKTSSETFNHEAPTIIFVHGAGMDHTVWALPFRYFTRHEYNVIGVDLPGHGRSEGPPLASIAEQADWLIAWLDALGIERAAIAGHSMGSLTAIATAARHPTRVRTLALLGSTAPMAVSEPLLSNSEADNHLAMDMVNIWGLSSTAQIGGVGQPGMWIMGNGIRLLECSDEGVLFADLNACNSYTNALEDATKIQCSVHLILGNRDIMTPAKSAAKLLEALTDKEVTILNECGHTMLSERPNEVLDALAGCL